ncbi:MAG: HAD family hydrolase [Paracoccaceae bacterium]|nr:HAD family hydrolase [Paracoccaceae bacterium]
MALEPTDKDGRSIRGVLFDKDGTLFDFGGTWGEWADRVLGDLAPRDPDLRIRLGHAGGYDVETGTFMPGSRLVNAAPDDMNAVWAQMLPHLTVDEIDAIGRKWLSDLKPKPVRHLREALGQLDAMGLVLGVATNDYSFSAHDQLQDAGVRQLFAFVCGYDSGYGAKPGPGMVEAFANATGICLSEVAMVGDSTNDIQAGRAAGAGMVIGVLTGPARRTELQGDADAVLESVAELPDLLSGRAVVSFPRIRSKTDGFR